MFQNPTTMHKTAKLHDLQFIVHLILLKVARMVLIVCFVCAVCSLIWTGLCEPRFVMVGIN